MRGKIKNPSSLSRKKSIYYPYMDPELNRHFSSGFNSSDHNLYLKVLSLVSTFIIIPPSHIIRVKNIYSVFKDLQGLLEREEGITSSISKSHGDRDFKDYYQRKREHYSGLGKDIDSMRYRDATELFGKLPIFFQRDTNKQKSGFEEGISSFFNSDRYEKISSPQSDRAAKVILNSQKPLTRSEILKILNQTTKDTDSKVHGAILEYVMAEYFKQGGRLNYSALPPVINYICKSGKNIPEVDINQLKIYDPELLLGVFARIGIPRTLISRLMDKDLIEVRNTKVFNYFLNQLESIIQEANSLTRDELKEEIAANFVAQRRQLEKFDTLSTIFLKTLELVLDHFIGPASQLLKLTKLLKDPSQYLERYILNRVWAAKQPLAVFERELKRIVDKKPREE